MAAETNHTTIQFTFGKRDKFSKDMPVYVHLNNETICVGHARTSDEGERMAHDYIRDQLLYNLPSVTVA